MKVAIENFVGVLIICIMILLGTSYITSAITIQNAQNFHASVTSEIEASDFSDQVIANCISKAKENGYKTSSGASSLSVSNIRTENGKIAKVILKYTYKIPLLNMNLTGEIVGYARG